jgi:ABC-2 type transport system ATP-binding protein
MDEADALCDRVAIIDYGKIKAIGKPSELKGQIGGDIITVKFAKSAKDLLESVLEKIKKLQFVENIIQARDYYNIIAKNGDTTIPKIFGVANENGVTVESISLKRPSLDDVFLTYTGRALREEETTSEAFMRQRMAMRRARA